MTGSTKCVDVDTSGVVLDGPLDEVIASLAALRDQVPPEHRAELRVRIDSEVVDDYDTVYAKTTVEAWYECPLTPEEVAAEEIEKQRQAMARANQHAAELLREYETYLTLKAKFEPKITTAPGSST